MTYLSDRARNRRQYRYYIVGALALAALVYFWPAIRTSVYPRIESTVVSFGTSKNALFRIPFAIQNYFTSHAELASRSAALSLTIEHLENELAEKNAILKEEGLRTTSGTLDVASTLVMYPLVRDATSIYSTVILSKGFKDGIVERDLVYVHGRQPVCTIIEVYDRTSLCKLLTAYGETTEGVVASTSVSFTLKGDGGGTFIIEVPRDTAIAPGELVYLKSNPSMTLGTITDVVRNDQAVAWRVYVRGAYNPVTSSVFYINK